MLVEDRKGEQGRGCSRLRGYMEAPWAAILLGVDVCLGILGVPSAV